MKRIYFLYLLLVFALPAKALNVLIIDPTGSGYACATNWQSVATSMGHTVTIANESTLNTTTFIAGTDILIVSVGATSVYTTTHATNIQTFLQTGKSAYIQGEYQTTYSGNQLFSNIVTSMGGSFTWGSTVAGQLLPDVNGTLSSNSISVPSLPYYWYGATATAGLPNVQPILTATGTTTAVGWVYTSCNAAYGRLFTTTDQDWVGQSTSYPGCVNLMQNILTHLANKTLGYHVTPYITASPDSVSCGPVSTTYSVTPGCETITGYQWYKNGSPVSTASTYSITTPVNGDQVYCNITTATGTNATNTITMNVKAVPVIDTVADLIICNGSPSGAINFTSSVSGTTYAWANNNTSIGLSTSGTGNINTFTPTGITAATTARIIVTPTANGCVGKADTFFITVVPVTEITALTPMSITACEGINDTFAVTATGGNLAYQWEVNTGSGWGNVPATGYNGQTTNRLIIVAPPASFSGYEYRCIVSGSCSTDTSDTASITVRATPTITTEPKSIIRCATTTGDEKLYVAATGYNITYQWQVHDGTTWANVPASGYSGQTSDTLTLIAPPATFYGYQYRCIVSGGCAPPDTSVAADFLLATPATATAQHDTVCQGNTATLGVIPSGGVIVNWYSALTGGSYLGTGNTLSVPGALTPGTYYAELIDSNVSSFNSGATVSNGLGGAMFDMDILRNLVLNSFDVYVDAGTYDFEIYYRQGTCIGNQNSPAVWTKLGTYTGNTSAAGGYRHFDLPTSLTLKAGQKYAFYITSTTAYNGGPVRYQTASGTTGDIFKQTGDIIVRTGYGLSPGFSTNYFQPRMLVFTANFTRPACTTLTRTPVTLTIDTLPSITIHPVATNMTVCENTGTASCSATATGTNVSYQWQVNAGSGWTNIATGGVYNITAGNLSIVNPPATMNGYQYRCFAAGTCVPADTSNAVTLTVNTPPLITTHPANTNMTVCAGAGTASCTTAATGTAIAYQWQVNAGSGWTNIATGGVYTITAGNLSIANAPATMNGYLYRSYVTGTCTPADTSNTATLTVNTAPVFTVQPANTNMTVCEGAGTASCSATATGTNVSYQWQVNSGSGWTNIATGGVYSIIAGNLSIVNPPAGMNSYLYRAYATGTCLPSDTSGTVALTVRRAPVVTGHPTSITRCEGINDTFTIAATGYNLTYQWQVNTGTGWNNVPVTGYSGQTTTSLIVLAPTASFNGYQYRCVVTGGCAPPVTSNAATLNILSQPVITFHPLNITRCEGINDTFIVTATGYNLSYQWQYNSGSGWTNVPVAGYAGHKDDTLYAYAPPVALNGYQYRCVVTGGCGGTATSNTATLTLYGKPAITSQPVNTAVCVGSTASFTVGTTGTNLTYQWRVNTGSGWANVSNGGIYSGATTNTLSITGAPLTSAGNYQCIISGTCAPPITTNTVTLWIYTAPGITSQPTDKIVCVGSNTSISVNASANGGTPISYQWEVDNGSGYTALTNGAPYSGVNTHTLNITAAPASLDGYRYRCVVSTPCTPSATSMAARLTVKGLPTITQHPVPSTVCPGSIATFSVAATGAGLTYQWQVNTGSGWSNVPATSEYSGNNSPTLTVNVQKSMASNLLRCIVSGDCAPPAISNSALLTALITVDIKWHDQSDSVCSGGMTRISLGASGTSLRYQWQVKNANGTYSDLLPIPPYSGITTDSLRIVDAPDSLDGKIYRCKVYETVVCNQIEYTGDIPLHVTQSPDITPGAYTVPFFSSVSFSVTPDGTKYQWQENKNDGAGFRNLNENSTYSGVYTNTLTIKPVSFQMSGYWYRCLIDGVCVTPMLSKAGRLTVDPALAVSNVSEKNDINMQVYPNPLSGTQLTVRFDKILKGETTVRVLDKLGKLVYNSKISLDAQHSTVLELQQLAAGMYMLQVVNENEAINQTVQFVKE